MQNIAEEVADLTGDLSGLRLGHRSAESGYIYHPASLHLPVPPEPVTCTAPVKYEHTSTKHGLVAQFCEN